MKINLSKSNIIVLIISGLTIPLLIVGIFYLTKSEKPNSSLLKIIPVDACIILQTNDLNSLNQKIKPIDNVLKLFSCSKTFENLCNNIFFIDSLLNTNLNFKEFAKNAEAVVSIHQTGKETSEYIFSISTKKTITENDVINIINKTTKNIAIISKTNYENSQIFEVKTLDKYIFSFCLHKNIIVFSYSNEMLKKMIRQISSSSTLFNDKNFSCVYKNADENAPLNLFLNYKLLSETKDLFFDFKNQQNTNLFSNFANWSAFDFSFDTNSIRLNGYTSINQSFLQIF